MQSNQPIPGEPWPHDMVLTITNDSDVLLQLLWIRQAWNLHPEGDDWPPLIPDLPLGNADPTAPAKSARPALAESWGQIWQAATSHVGNRPSPDLLEEARTASTPARRTEILTAFMGPSWIDEHGDAGFGEPYRAWREELLRSLIAEQHSALEHTPERQSLPALIDAWQNGLQVIITVPAPGTYTRSVGRHGLLMTAETHADSFRYTEALRTFTPEG